MIYECPNCQTPQEAGQTICPRCHAQFDGPVPDDAVVPALDAAAAEGSAPEAAAEGSAPEAAAEGSAPETAPTTAAPPEAPPVFAAPEAPPVFAAPEAPPVFAAPEAPPVFAVPEAPPVFAAPEAPPVFAAPEAPPAAAPSPLTAVSPPGAQAYPDAPAYPPQSYAPRQPVTPPFGSLSRVLLIAFPIVLVLVLGGVFWANSLNSDADTAPAPLPAVRSSALAPPPAAPVSTPTILQGAGNGSSTADDPRAKMLAGRWESKSGNFYVFHSDGTGSRGNPATQQPEQPFLWGLVQNRLMLYRDKNEQLRFNAGPDDDTIFLAGPTGPYVQYSRSKT